MPVHDEEDASHFESWHCVTTSSFAAFLLTAAFCASARPTSEVFSFAAFFFARPRGQLGRGGTCRCSLGLRRNKLSPRATSAISMPAANCRRHRRRRRIPETPCPRQRRSSRPLPGELNEKARMIETGDVVEPTPGKLKRVAALAAAQVQDLVAMRKSRRRDQDVDLLSSEPVILDDVAVGAQIERAKQRTPPIGRHVACEVAERTGRAGPAPAAAAPSPRRHPREAIAGFCSTLLHEFLYATSSSKIVFHASTGS